MSIRNIQVFVDALALASGEVHARAVFLVDDCVESVGRGTLALRSVVAPGDLVRWSLIPIDLQAPAFIRALTFEGAHAGMHFRDADVPAETRPAPLPPGEDPVPSAVPGEAASPSDASPSLPGQHAVTSTLVGRSLVWEGIVPMTATDDAAYPYVLHLAFTDRHPMTIRVEGPALRVRSAGAPALPHGSLLAADDVL